jgi:Pyridoxal-phosphate dependent enzyme
LAVEVLTALGERDATIAATEQRAGAASTCVNGSRKLTPWRRRFQPVIARSALHPDLLRSVEVGVGEEAEIGGGAGQVLHCTGQRGDVEAGGLFSGVATAAQHHGIRTIAVEPENCRALNAALEAGRVVDVPVESVAADSLGARRVSEMALQAAQHKTVRSVLVPDADIIAARHALWNHRCLAVERAAGTALAGLLSPADYRRAAGEKVCVVLCGANTDPA